MVFEYKKLVGGVCKKHRASPGKRLGECGIHIKKTYKKGKGAVGNKCCKSTHYKIPEYFSVFSV